jgi:hypothetical protein
VLIVPLLELRWPLALEDLPAVRTRLRLHCLSPRK